MSTYVHTPWIVRIQPNVQVRARIFCFPYAGGAASAFVPWKKLLPDDIDLCAIQLHGRENRLKEPLFTRLPDLVAVLATELSSYMDVPFVFLGHSLGTLIAFELTRYLRKQAGRQPQYLFFSGRNAPQTSILRRNTHTLPEREFIAEVQAYNGTPSIIFEDEDLRRVFVPLLRADFALFETYQYREDAPLDIPLSVFGGLQDPMTTKNGLEAWQEQTRNTFSLRMLPGEHFFIHPQRVGLLQYVLDDLTEIL